MIDRDELDLTTEQGREQFHREIAKLAGYYVKDVNELKRVPEPTWMAFAPDHNPIHCNGDIGWRREHEAWQCIPNFPHDLNAALTLFADLPLGVTPRLVRVLVPQGDEISYQWKACIIDSENREEWEEISDNAATAISLCWYAYKEHMKLREAQ